MSEPTPELWRRLYDLAGQIWAARPWGLLQETQVFGVRDPEDPGRVGFVSVMGSAGEFPAITVYLGRQALWDFRRLTLHPDELSMEEAGRLLLLTPQVMLSFEHREDLAEEDRALMERLGVDWRGDLYPVFRAYRPGYFPWFLEEDEARFLALVLEQLLALLPRVERGELILRPEDHPEYYIRSLVTDEEEGPHWEGRWEEVEPPPLRRVRFSLPESEIEKAAALPQGEDVLEVQMELAPEIGPIQEQPGERPFFPYLFMAVHSAAPPQILEAQLVQPGEAAELAESFARLLLGTFHKLGRRPREVRMAPRAHYVQVAQWLSGLTDFRVRVEPLKHLPDAWAFLAQSAQDTSAS